VIEKGLLLRGAVFPEKAPGSLVEEVALHLPLPLEGLDRYPLAEVGIHRAYRSIGLLEGIERIPVNRGGGRAEDENRCQTPRDGATSHVPASRRAYAFF